MIDLLPAIDLKDGKVVRLTRGDYSQVTVYSDNPLEFAKKWIDEGADWLHFVDLDAALEGTPKNLPALRQLSAFLLKNSKKFQIGGGIRNQETVRLFIEELGANRLILGTAAAQNPKLVEEVCKKYPGKIAVGIDVKDGKVATKGWTEVAEQSPVELATFYSAMGVACIVYTDIQRDGMLSGINIDAIETFVDQISLPVIIAGGVKNLADLQKLIALRSSKLIGAITGKAIYEGTLSLKEAIELSRIS